MATTTTKRQVSRAKRGLIDLGLSLYTEDRLPKEFAWIEHLTESHRRQFFYEFKKAMSEALVEDDISVLEEVVNDWQATAEIDSNPDFKAELIRRANAPASEFVDLDSLRD